MSLLGSLLPPGFLTSAPVQTALAVSFGAAVVSGIVGVFTLIRGQAFAGHALADVSSAGGAASYVLGINPLFGFVLMAALGAGGMELIGLRRAREQGLATGIVLGAGLGLSALFLYFDVTMGSTTGAAITVMFGSMFAIPAAIAPLALGAGLGAMAAIFLLYRPLLLLATDPDLAQLRGIPVRLLGFLNLLVLAVAVALSAMTVGAILSTALLIGPAAIALRLARRPGAALLLSAAIGLAASWGGLLMAYDSYYWTPGHGWPVSFCIVALIFGAYLGIVQVPDRLRRRFLPATAR